MLLRALFTTVSPTLSKENHGIKELELTKYRCSEHKKFHHFQIKLFLEQNRKYALTQAIAKYFIHIFYN